MANKTSSAINQLNHRPKPKNLLCVLFIAEHVLILFVPVGVFYIVKCDELIGNLVVVFYSFTVQKFI